jgi:hypothetical protein
MLAFNAHFMGEMQLFSRTMSFPTSSFVTRGRQERKLQAMRFHTIVPSHCPSIQRPKTRLLAYTPYLELLLRATSKQRRGSRSIPLRWGCAPALT